MRSSRRSERWRLSSDNAQPNEFAVFLNEHGRNGVGIAYYVIQCPKCKAPAGIYCGMGTPTSKYRIHPTVCAVRKQLWEAMGRPSIIHTEVNPLLLKMIEAADDEIDQE